MKLGKLGIWAGLEALELPAIIETAQRIEALGYSALWHPMCMQRDLMLLASTVLANTKNLQFATGILPIFERTPPVVAAAQRDLEELYPGRFLLGLGISHQPIVEGIHKQVYGPPLVAMGNFLDGMDRGLDFNPLLGLEPNAELAAATPVQTGPARVIGALGPKMMALSRDRAQGAHPYFMPPAHTRDARDILGPEPLLCPEVKVVLCEDAAKARDAAREAGAVNITLENYQKTWRNYGFDDADFANGGSDRLIDGTVAWGNLEQVKAFLQQHWDAGASHLALHMVNPEGQAAGLPWDAIEALAP